MVKNITPRNAFSNGLKDERRLRPLDAEPEHEAQSVEPVRPVRSAPQEPAADLSNIGGSQDYVIPRDKRIGSRINEKNWRAWKETSLRTGISLSALINAAFEHCYVDGNIDLTMARKYDEKTQH